MSFQSDKLTLFLKSLGLEERMRQEKVCPTSNTMKSKWKRLSVQLDGGTSDPITQLNFHYIVFIYLGFEFHNYNWVCLSNSPKASFQINSLLLWGNLILLSLHVIHKELWECSHEKGNKKDRKEKLVFSHCLGCSSPCLLHMPFHSILTNPYQGQVILS